MALVMTISPEEREVSKRENLQVNHFCHRHPLEASEIDEGVCSGCEHDIVGPAFVCTKPSCNFVLHDLCSDLPRRLRHSCHPNHPLILLPSPPYGDGEFTCDACGRSGHGFTYHCGACEFDLHVECAALPEIENRSDHLHPLVLVCDHKSMDGGDLVCYACDDRVAKGAWVYCCLPCKCALHLGCADNW